MPYGLEFESLTPEAAISRLRQGARMDQPTFHELYKYTPPGFKAELIGGVVFVASPLRIPHGENHFEAIAWLGPYMASTPGVRGRDNTTVILDETNETQPDVALVIDPAHGGQSTANEEEYAEGPPELIVEVSHSSTNRDLRRKRAEYERAGVLEYVVIDINADEVHWFRRQENGEFLKESPDEEGVYRSTVFPGLWLNARALLGRDSAAVFETVQQGMAEPEYAAFVRELAAKRVR